MKCTDLSVFFFFLFKLVSKDFCYFVCGEMIIEMIIYLIRDISLKFHY